MRMRRKKNLDERLSACADILIICEGDDLNFTTAPQKKDYIDFEKIFGNNNSLELEIGCGKGKFACEIAKRNPDINYIAVEKSSNVIVEACEKAKEEGIKNLIFLKCGAEYLERYIKDNSIDRIYLNFSCPFPKKKYAAHRLTNKHFLSIYKSLLKSGGEIHQKTDNRNFFEYSIEQFSDFGYILKNISLDLHNSGFEDNIVTEYETKFSDGPIYRLEAYLR